MGSVAGGPVRGATSGRDRRVRRPASVLAAVALALLTAGGLAAQDLQGKDEATLLREAAALESRGDLDGASALLRDLLERHPTSSGGLFALERVLRARGTLADVLPFADRFLEADPHGAGARYLKLRVLVDVDSLEALEEEGRRWIEAEPGSPEPYRQMARLYQRAFGPRRALELLRQGRDALADSVALALETGEVLLELDRPGEAVTEWSRALGPDGSDLATVLRRMEELEADPSRVALPLARALDTDPTTPARRRAAVRIAVEAGLQDEALAVAEHVLPALEVGARRGFLVELARRGEEEGRTPKVTLWAYRRLRDLATDERERRALDMRIAAAALAAADTSAAVEARSRLARGLPPGSDDRRRVMADLIRVQAGRADADDLADRLAAFRDEFPDAPELDELASVVAAGLQARGEIDRAMAALEGVEGPRSAVERGYLMLERGQTEAARKAFGDALPGLPPGEATPVIQLMGLLGRLGDRGRELVRETAVLSHRGHGAEAVRRIRDGVPDIPEEEQATVLAQGARVADAAALREEAAGLREELLETFPDAPEAGEATLALARYRAETDDGVAEAVRLLEALILRRPEAPLVPDARRELEKLKARGGKGSP